jgi:hypothetical protein
MIDMPPQLYSLTLAEQLASAWYVLSPAARQQLENLTWDQPPPMAYWNQRLDNVPEEYQEVFGRYAYKISTILCEMAHARLLPVARAALGYSDQGHDQRTWNMIKAPTIIMCSPERRKKITGAKNCLESGKLAHTVSVSHQILYLLYLTRYSH